MYGYIILGRWMHINNKSGLDNSTTTDLDLVADLELLTQEIQAEQDRRIGEVSETIIERGEGVVDHELNKDRFTNLSKFDHSVTTALVSVPKFYNALREANRQKVLRKIPKVPIRDYEDYAKYKLILTNDNLSGIAVTKRGVIGSFFKHPDSASGTSVKLVQGAIREGGTYVGINKDNHILIEIYHTNGFVPNGKKDDTTFMALDRTMVNKRKETLRKVRGNQPKIEKLLQKIGDETKKKIAKLKPSASFDKLAKNLQETKNKTPDFSPLEHPDRLVKEHLRAGNIIWTKHATSHNVRKDSTKQREVDDKITAFE